MDIYYFIITVLCLVCGYPQLVGLPLASPIRRFGKIASRDLLYVFFTMALGGVY
jgi:hypothetical protein